MASKTTIQCPECGGTAVETMPTDCCVYFWECPACHAMVKPKAGDCCVFCSYGSAPCPPKSAVASTGPQRWARILPRYARQWPSLYPDTWYQVLEEGPHGIHDQPLPGYVWLGCAGQPLFVPAQVLEIVSGGPERLSGD